MAMSDPGADEAADATQDAPADERPRRARAGFKLAARRRPRDDAGHDTSGGADQDPVPDGPRSKVHIVGVGALLGTGTSRRKARASQLNGRLGGRPRKTA